MYKYVTDFKVLEFNEWSDNAPIYLSFNKCMKEEHGENNHDSNGVCDSVIFYRWNQEHVCDMRNDFKNVLYDLNCIVSTMEEGMNISESISTFTQCLNNIFEPYCKHTVFDKQRSKGVIKNKLWFDERCRYLYNIYIKKNCLNIANVEATVTGSC